MASADRKPGVKIGRRLLQFKLTHYQALACGGPDAVWNMQWQTIRDARAKDRWERRACAR
jgi:hypothetical protein